MTSLIRLSRLLERELERDAVEFLFASAMLLVRVAELAEGDADARARAGALIVAIGPRLREDERARVYYDVAPFCIGEIAEVIGHGCVLAARATTRPSASLWLRAAGALGRGGADPTVALAGGLAAAEPTCAKGDFLGESAALGIAIAEMAREQTKGRWSPLACAALDAWLLSEDPKETRADRAKAIHPVLLPHRNAAEACYRAILPWLGLAEVREILAQGPVEYTDLFDALAARLAALGQFADAIAMLGQHPALALPPTPRLHREVQASARLLLPFLPEAEAHALIAKVSTPDDVLFWHHANVLAWSDPAEIERRIESRRRHNSFQALAELAHVLPAPQRGPVLIELIQSPDRHDHAESFFRLIPYASELAADAREELIATCVEMLEAKGGYLICNYDNVDVATLLEALARSARLELLDVIARSVKLD